MTSSGTKNTDTAFIAAVLSGGDERLDLLETGTNRYHVQPDRFVDVFNRGSCTCSPFTENGYRAATEVYRKIESHRNFYVTRRAQAERIKSLINYTNHDEFHVFFAPSGSDLCYYQLLFAKLIDPSKDILNIVTCPEELGSGSIAAMKGLHYASRNQFSKELSIGKPISDSLHVRTKMLSARDNHGRINNHSIEIDELVAEYYESYSVNANLVIGSKSGIENNISIVSQVPEGVLWTVDLCQFRASRVLVNGLLGMNCSVMLTGSKFYQSPPFCAALLVPKVVTQRFRKFSESTIKPFADIFSKYDIPDEFPEIQKYLTNQENIGLILRWEAALDEMELLAKLDDHHINRTMSAWNAFVSSKIAGSEVFELMPGQELTNKTIISFRVKAPDGEYLDHDQLRSLYTNICSQDVRGVGKYRRVLFGQPVKYGDKSFIRIALGASDLRQFVLEGFESSDDSNLVDLIEAAVREQF